MIKDQVASALQSVSNISVSNGKREKETGVPLGTTYHPRLKDLSSLIKRNLQYRYADQEVNKVFTPAPFVSFKSARNLECLLVRSKVYPLERKVGSEKRNGKRCLVCVNVTETDTFESFQTKKQYKINYNLNCKDKCLIYLSSCKICGLQYASSTTDPFRYCQNNYKGNNRKDERDRTLFEHSASHGHNGFLEDCTISLTDKSNVADPTGRGEYLEDCTGDCVTLWVESCRLEVPHSYPFLIHFSEASVSLT